MVKLGGIEKYYETYPEAVLITDYKTREMVYRNQIARKVDFDELQDGLDHSWQEQHRSDNGEPDLYLFHKVDYFNEKLGHSFRIKSCLVRDPERIYQVSIMVNYTREWRRLKTLHSLLQTESMVSKSLRIATGQDNPEEGIHALLDQLGQQLECTRVFVYEDNGDGTFSNSYEWVSEEKYSLRDDQQNLAFKGIIEYCYRIFKEHHGIKNLSINDAKKNNEPLYQFMLERQVKSLVIGPLIDNNQIIGFYGVDNPGAGYNRAGANLFDSIGYFIVALLNNRNSEYSLAADALTGVSTRHALQRRLEKINKDESVCYIFVDLNNLKRVNDLQGHNSGDHLIVTAARVMSYCLFPEPVFRMGGDEFLAILTGISESKSYELESALKKHFQNEGVDAAIGTYWSEKADEPFEEIFRKVDQRMYVNKRNLHRARQDAEYSFEAADHIPAACIVCGNTEEQRIYYMNQEAIELLGCRTRDEADELTGGVFHGVIYPDDYDSFLWQFNNSDNRHHFLSLSNKEPEADSNKEDRIEIVCRINTKSGNPVSVFTVGRTYASPMGGYVYVLLFPLRDAKLFDIDRLTGLGGMRQLFSFADQCIKENPEKTRYFIYTNVSGFSLYNEKYGFEAGDHLLEDIAGFIREFFPESGIAYTAPDRFMIFTDADDFMDRLRKIQSNFSRRTRASACELKIGVYTIESGSRLPVYAAADYAKAACDSLRRDSRRFICFYNQDLIERDKRNRYIVQNVDKAIENGYVKVYYQPIIRTITGNISSFEALSRWDDPTYGHLNPGEFIDILEEWGKIYKLDCFILEEVCRELRKQIDQGHSVVPICFNISRSDVAVENVDLFTTIDNIVKSYRISPSLIKVEITENLIIKEPERMQDLMNKLSNAGYLVCMDDFGSGYSSLNVMTGYPFDVLKIDREFLRNFTDSNRKVISSTVALAKKLGIRVLAEGVETEEHLAFLKKIGCGGAQGFLFSRPAPYDVSLKRCLDQGRRLEDSQWRNYYEAIDAVEFQEKKPICIVEYDGSSIQIIYSNSLIEKIWRELGFDTPENWNGIFETGKYPENVTMLKEFVDQNQWKFDEPRSIELVEGSQFFTLTFTLLAENDGKKAFLFNLQDMGRAELHYKKSENFSLFAE